MCNTHAYSDNYKDYNNIVLHFFIVDYTSVVHYTRVTSVRSTMSESSAAF